ncbi:hypothetical protein HK097_008934 [Rhizophlyctis rosea]|uniref:Uncharacterized protein n=1 Tax=Rhizophlyctis rosea TaxID=64517 RepID=A0AAD5SCM5_9FUNG|nr:hypothetical protein HK097_008934 [Rhizophlyctis rosea]
MPSHKHYRASEDSKIAADPHVVILEAKSIDHVSPVKPIAAGASPEGTKAILSWFTYGWMNPLFKIGYRRPLETSDLYDLDDKHTSAAIVEGMESQWNRIVDEGLAKIPEEVGTDGFAAGRKLPAGTERRLLFRTIWAALGRDFLISGAFRLVADGLVLASPMLLQALVRWIKGSDQVGAKGLWYGIVLAIVFFVMQVVTTFLNNLCHEMSMKIGYNLRTSLIQMLYAKTFRLSSLARQTFTAGKIVNILATDTNRMDRTCQSLHNAWSTPMQIVVAGALLIWVLGPAALVGFFCFAAFLPVQGLFSRYLAGSRRSSNLWADQRIRMTQESIQGIRAIKAYAWEGNFLRVINDLRNKELVFIKNASVARGLTWALTQLVPTVAMILTFVTYYKLGHAMDPIVIMPALALFYALRVPMIIMPMLLDEMTDAWIAAERIGQLLLASELEQTTKLLPPSTNASERAIEIQNASFTWESPIGSADSSKSAPIIAEKAAIPFSIRNISVSIPQGSLTAIIGPIGSGKSSFLQSLIGEMRLTEGRAPTIRTSALSYVSQAPWIQNATLKENILFGAPYDEKKYERVIRECALERDLELLPAGDETEIGEKGVNLSGGQKQRVNLARAVYFGGDVVLMDDPLSAVDAHVGRYLFETCIRGTLKSTTRLLVTHQLHFLPQVDNILVMKDGRIVEQGTYAELMANGAGLAELMKEFGGAGGKKENEEPKVEEEHEAATADKVPNSGDVIDEGEGAKKTEQGKLVVVEDRESGAVKTAYYGRYAKFCGGWPWISMIIFFVSFTQITRVLTDNWLSWWTNRHYELPGNTWIGIYFAIGLTSGASIITQAILVALAGTRAGKRIHELALKTIFKAPVRFYDENPVGRIINRFSRDIDTLDNILKESYRVGLFAFAMTIANLVYIAVIFPYFILFAVPSLILYYLLQNYYRATSRELRRLDSIARSPLVAHYSETLTGLATLRAYGSTAQRRAQQRTAKLLDDNNRAYYLYIMTRFWLSARLESLSSCLILVASIFAVVAHKSIGAGTAGLVLTYALQITLSFNSCTRQIADTEMNMNAAERMVHYCLGVDSEKEGGNEVQKDWPAKGDVSVDGLELRYRPDLPPVLKGVSFKIDGGLRVGIVGRTGAGKSSIIAALLRLVEPSSGSITIDGVDLTGIQLDDLRSRIAIIPQDPVLFSGTVRFNLDPFGQYEDADLWDVLERASIKDNVSSSPQGLDSIVSENGDNWSTGQRQLLCLARALLKRSRIIILDEATASVDFATDAHIQHIIRTDPAVASATVLTIAHRLNTVADYDRILVLSAGEVIEFDSPSHLLGKEGSVFRSMVEETGRKNAVVIKELARRGRV